MPLNASQIVARACSIAKVPGYVQQGGQYLNAILSELCQNYDFDVARGIVSGVFNPSISGTPDFPNVQPGAGPYTLPSDYLRVGNDKEAIWYLQGVPYPMIPVDISEYDNLVQQAGLQSYPYIFATDMSQVPPVFVTYPPASGAYPYSFRYYRQMPDITTPETSNVVPWFPNTNYLITRLSADLMQETDDDRRQAYLNNADGTDGILARYIKMKDDKTKTSQQVRLDRRQFGRRFSSLPNTKTIGW